MKPVLHPWAFLCLALPIGLRQLMLKLSEPPLFPFSLIELFQEIDSYAKQCSKEHNAERIWEWVLKKTLAGNPVQTHSRAESRKALQTSQEAAGIPSTIQPCSGDKCTVASLYNNVQPRKQHLPNLGLRNLRAPRPINHSNSWKFAQRNFWTQPLMTTQHLFGNNRVMGISSLLCGSGVRHTPFVLWGPEHEELFQWHRTRKW